jgi:hypothetical protein
MRINDVLAFSLPRVFVDSGRTIFAAGTFFELRAETRIQNTIAQDGAENTGLLLGIARHTESAKMVVEVSKEFFVARIRDQLLHETLP